MESLGAAGEAENSSGKDVIEIFEMLMGGVPVQLDVK